MKKIVISKASNEELIELYTLLVMKSVKQENFSGGTTAETTNKINKVFVEMSKRFGLDLEILQKMDF